MSRLLGYLAILALALAMHYSVAAQNNANADFDGDGTVGFSDFLAFAGQYGTQRGDGRYQAKYDLNSDGMIDFADFLLFASSFGNTHIPAANSGQPVVDQNIDLPAGNYIQFRFTVDTDTQQNVVLQGEFSVENGTVQMAVMNESEFRTWQTGGMPGVLYSPGNTSGETFRLPIDDSDTYYIVFRFC